MIKVDPNSSSDYPRVVFAIDGNSNSVVHIDPNSTMAEGHSAPTTNAGTGPETLSPPPPPPVFRSPVA